MDAVCMEIGELAMGWVSDAATAILLCFIYGVVFAVPVLLIRLLVRLTRRTASVAHHDVQES